MRRDWVFGLLMAAALFCSLAQRCDAAVSFFSDDFESGSLSQWSPNLSGQIVIDPLNPSNRVLNFAQTAGGGDIFSAQQITTTSTYTLDFDYLGLAPHPARGFVGIQGSSEFWIAGDNWPGLLIQLNTLESNNGWHHYHVVFVSPVGNSVKLKLEDFVGLGGQPGNAYFDNIVLRDSAISAVPEPTSFIVWSLLAIAGVVAYCRHSKGSLTQQESKLS